MYHLDPTETSTVTLALLCRANEAQRHMDHAASIAAWEHVSYWREERDRAVTLRMRMHDEAAQADNAAYVASL